METIPSLSHGTTTSNAAASDSAATQCRPVLLSQDRHLIVRYLQPPVAGLRRALEHQRRSDDEGDATTQQTVVTRGQEGSGVFVSIDRRPGGLRTTDGLEACALSVCAALERFREVPGFSAAFLRLYLRSHGVDMEIGSAHDGSEGVRFTLCTPPTMIARVTEAIDNGDEAADWRAACHAMWPDRVTEVIDNGDDAADWRAASNAGPRSSAGEFASSPLAQHLRSMLTVLRSELPCPRSRSLFEPHVLDLPHAWEQPIALVRAAQQYGEDESSHGRKVYMHVAVRLAECLAAAEWAGRWQEVCAYMERPDAGHARVTVHTDGSGQRGFRIEFLQLWNTPKRDVQQ